MLSYILLIISLVGIAIPLVVILVSAFVIGIYIIARVLSIFPIFRSTPGIGAGQGTAIASLLAAVPLLYLTSLLFITATASALLYLNSLLLR